MWRKARANSLNLTVVKKVEAENEIFMPLDSWSRMTGVFESQFVFISFLVG
jgi:hypothetical protein